MVVEEEEGYIHTDYLMDVTVFIKANNATADVMD